MGHGPYVQFYTSDFLAGTGGMTASTKGVYITIICMIYEAEAPLPQSWDSLARQCGCTLPAFKKAIQELQRDGKIEVTDAGIWSPKCEKHLTLRRERQSSARAAAESRWQKTKQNQRQDDATALRTQCQPEPEPEPYKKEEAKASSKKGSRLPRDWSLPQEWSDWALAQGMDELSSRREADRFRDYWVSAPGQRGVKMDWQAVWRNWVRKWMDERDRRGHGAPPKFKIRARLPEEYQ